jgi:hypothetical protein
MELLKINKRQTAKENEIAEVFRQITSVEKEFDNTHQIIVANAEESDRAHQASLNEIHKKINENIDVIHGCIEKLKEKDFKELEINQEKSINNLLEVITKTKLELRDKDSAMKSYIDSRIDKTSKGIELVAEGLKNYYNEEELADRVYAKFIVKQKEENIKRAIEGLPIAGMPSHYEK